MPLSEELRTRLQGLIDSNDVVLFMKGNRAQPQCGFSARTVGILDGLVDEYVTVNVLANPEVRQGIKDFSEWPTIPQLYIKGEFVGGSDIVSQAAASGELHQMLGIDLEAVEVPEMTITQAAAARLAQAGGQGGDVVRFKIHPGYRFELSFGPRMYGDVEVTAHGATLVLDHATAKRAAGTVIDYAQDATGEGFTIHHPDEPPPVQQITPAQLKAWLDADEGVVVFDVRTHQERDTARIEGSVHLDMAGAAQLDALPRDTRIVFQCHHGVRSQQAAEHYRAEGFTQVFNLAGGIDAWSQQVDPGVPRY